MNQHQLALLLFLSGALGAACANPLVPDVVHGQVTFAHPDPNTLAITNSPGAIINWQSFGIDVGEITQFIQQGPSSAVLNRVVGQDPSAILGQLNSNGQVYLVNPNGIVVGQNAVIDTAGFIASTLSISDEDFKRGELSFIDQGNAGDIVNRGYIKVAEDGNVLLVAPSITNDGVIETNGGNLILAAGRAVTITSLDDPALQFDLQAPDNEVINLGELVVNHGAAEIFAGSITHQGSIQANSLRIDEFGRVQLVASEQIEVTDGALISANGKQGGEILIESGVDTVVRGSLEAIGTERGGDIHILGERVGLFDQADANASGSQGGGEVLIGGDFQGANDAIKNARQTQVGDKAVVRANADQAGDGGKVIVWADGYTGFTGRAEATAGERSGNGGFIEISGKENLAFAGEVDASAGNGEAGTVLFDPKNIDINDAGSAAVLTNNEFTESPATSVQMDPTDIIGILEGGTDVTLQANNDITITSDFVSTGAGALGVNLTLQAGRTIDIQSLLRFDSGSLDLIANDDAAQLINRDAGAGSIFIRNGQTVSTGPGFGPVNLSLGTLGTVGSITLEEAASISVFETSVSLVTAAGGSIVLAPSGLGSAADISTAGGNVTLIADTIDLQGSGTQIFASSGVGFRADIRLAPAAGSIAIVNTASGASGATLELEVADLQNIDVNGFADGFLIIGDTANTTDITIEDVFAPAGGGAIKDRVTFEGTGNLTINANLDGTGLTGVDSGHSFETDIGGDIVFNATVDSGSANASFLFGQNNAGATASFAAGTVASPLFAITGGGGVDALVGHATLNDVYIVNGANAGTLSNPNVSTIDFTNVENLNAGGGDDLIVFQTGGSLSGFVDGGAGSDTADYSSIATPINASLPVIGGTDGFDIAEAAVSGNLTNMNVIIGGSATDTLTGVNGDNTWTYSAADTGIFQTSLGGSPMLAFSAFENVTGGNLNDTFDVSSGSVSGTVDGGGGTSDVISYATRGSSLSFDLENLVFPSVGSVANINGVIGGTLSDGLTGANNSNVWNITANNTGNVDGFSFSAVEILIGGTADDRFVFSDGATVTQVQGASTPSLNVADFSAWTTSLTVTQTASNTFDVAGMSTNSNIGNVTTGAASDTFLMSNNALALFSGTLDGSAGVDSLDYDTNARNEAGGITVDLENGISTDVAGIINIEEFIGSTATTSNEIQGSNAGSTWVLTNDTDGTRDSNNFLNFDIVQGGTGVDTFTLPDGFDGAIQDLGGNNAFIFSGALGASAAVISGNGNDTFSFFGAGGAIDGFIDTAAGTDILQFNGGVYDLNVLPTSVTDIDINSGGTANINVNMSIGDLEINDTGVLGGTGDITLSTGLTISSGVVSNIINNSGTLLLDGTAVSTITIGAGGDLSVTGGGTFQNDGTLSVNGVVGGAQLNFDNTVTVLNNNALTVDVGQMNINSAFTNNGDITLTNSGTFGGLGASFTNGVSGTLMGNGTFVATNGLSNDGVIAPGLSIGTLNITGDLTFNSGSIYLAEVTSGLSADQLIVSGNVNLDTGAVLTIQAFGGYGGNGGDTFTNVLQAGGAIGGTSGVFDTVNQPGGFSLNPTYAASAMDLSVTGALFNTWVGGLVGDWDVLANWSFGTLPTAAEDVLIDTLGAVVTIDSLSNNANTLTILSGILLDVMAGSLTVQSASTIDGDVSVSGGSLAIQSATSVNGSFSWTAGTVSAPNTLTLNGVTNISGGDLSLNSAVIEHTNTSGSSSFTPSQFNLNGSTFRNTGTLAIGDVFLDQDSIGAGLFENTGTLNKSTPGTFDVSNSGTHSFSSTGTINILSGEVFINRDSVLSGSLTGPGVLNWANGSSEGSLNIGAGSTLRISSGTHTLSDNITYTGAGRVLWDAGTIALGGRTMSVDTELDITGSDTSLNGGGELIHNNTSGNSVMDVAQFNLNGSTFRNTAAAILQIDTPLVTDQVFYDQDSIGAGIFENFGTINKTGLGEFDVSSSGTLSFTNTGTLNVTAGQIFVNNTSSLDGNLTGAGKLVWNNGTSQGTLNVGAGTTFEITSGTHTLAAPMTFNGLGDVVWNGGTIALSSNDMTVNTPLMITGGTVNLNGGGALIHTDGSGTSVLSASDLNINGATFRNTAVGILQIDTPLVTDSVFYDQDSIGAGIFENLGTINKTGLGEFEVSNSGTLSFDNTGTMNISGGQIFVNNTAVLNGNLTGTGTLIWNNGSASANLNIGTGSTVEISGGTHTLTAPSSFSGLGTVVWTSGTLAGADLTVNTIFQVTGTSENTLNTMTLTHTNTSGSSVFDSTGTWNINGATFLNTGTIAVDSGAGTIFIDQDSIGGGIFNNQGTLNKIGSGRFEVFSGATLSFQNSGIIDMQAGEIFINNTSVLNGNLIGSGGPLIWNNGTSSGDLNIGAGSIFEISGGTHSFGSASTYSGLGTVRWLGGTIQGADLTVNTILEITGTAENSLNSVTLTHNNISGASIFDSTGTFNINGGTFLNAGTLDIDANASTVFIDQDSVGPGTFRNTGILNKTGTGRFEVFSGATLTFDNDGTLNLNAGEVFVDQPFTNDGIIDIAAAATLTGDNATFVNGATGTIQGTGTIGTTASGLSNQGLISPGNGNTGTLNVAGNLNFDSGGTFDVQLAPALVSDRIIVSGNVNINAGSILNVTTLGGYAGNFGDAFGGVLSASGSVNGAFPTINQPGFSVTPSYMIGPAGDMTLTVGGIFNTWTGAIDSNWLTPGNWSLGVVPDSTMDVRINTAGQNITVGGTGTQIINTLGVVSGSSLQFLGANLQLNGTSTINGDLLIGTTLSGAGDIVSNGTFELTNGNLNGLGDIFINNLFSLNNTGGVATIGQTVNINSGGTATWQAGAQNINNGGGGNVQVLSGGTFNVQSNATTDLDFAIASGGSFTKTAGAGSSFFTGNVVNNGSIDAQAGTMSVTGTFTDNGDINIGNTATFAVPAGFNQNGGVTNIDAGGTLDVGANAITLLAGGMLTGNGGINGDLNNVAGVVSPGTSPGALLITGNFTQGPGGTLLIEIQNPGLTQGTDYDHITVTGTAVLDGLLQVGLLGGFIPAQGQVFDILNYSSASGAFASIPDVDLMPGAQAFTGVDQGLSFQLTAGDVALPTTPTSPVEPVAPALPAEDVGEADLSEVIALDENDEFFELLPEEEDDSEDEEQYKVCSG